MQIKLVPSLQSADLTCLRTLLAELEAAGADEIHVDAADGHFAPNLIFGPPCTRAIRQCTRLPISVHLMITDPARYAPDYIEAGASVVLFHPEAAADVVGVARLIHARGARAGCALTPDASPQSVEAAVGELDCLMAMTVHPGFSGQGFIEAACRKIPVLRRMFGSDIDIYVDGGVSPQTIGTAARYGANVFVASAAVFQAGVPPAEAMRRLREAAQAALV